MVNRIRKFIIRFIIDSILAFLFYTAAFTPYMIFIVKMSLEQYLAWIVMEITIVPPLGAIFSIIVRKINPKS